MTINSKSKGKIGERELAEFFVKRGFKGRRGVQFHGRPESPDIVLDGIGHLHFECKRVEIGSYHKWFKQACKDCGDKTPVVAHRRNRGEWMAILRLEDFIKLCMADIKKTGRVKLR